MDKVARQMMYFLDLVLVWKDDDADFVMLRQACMLRSINLRTANERVAIGVGLEIGGLER
jgi:hypothetical protein